MGNPAHHPMQAEISVHDLSMYVGKTISYYDETTQQQSIIKLKAIKNGWVHGITKFPSIVEISPEIIKQIKVHQ